jgi:hypothetical protein
MKLTLQSTLELNVGLSRTLTLQPALQSTLGQLVLILNHFMSILAVVASECDGHTCILIGPIVPQTSNF